ncbi:hypothetical protein OH76DRAFT_164773 [Lentinus brumalis]|uniref:Uncharacterized protein n=1 Tax=Lentinus brumalis TaxID=2498619 RepID=A0A371DIZ9_9APHY|nr:hypothetical protein OH76DRAFT_164773 [Polyporus brumalis]
MSSVLPQWILRIIWTQWFHMQAEHYPNTSAQWLYHHRDFSKHDIIFEFRDCFGKVELVRCNAQEFLTSPWAAPGPQGGTMACFVQSETETNIDLLDEPWILGSNFFWAAMLRLDATHRGDRPIPGQSTPYIQFAPQRIVRNGQKVAGPWDLELHAHLPPRMQATLRGQPELLV